MLFAKAASAQVRCKRVVCSHWTYRKGANDNAAMTNIFSTRAMVFIIFICSRIFDECTSLYSDLSVVLLY